MIKLFRTAEKSVFRRSRLRSTLLGGVTVLATWPALAVAQDTPPPASEDQSVEDEVIVVTAQFREQSIQDVPISIAVFGEEQLAAQGATSLTDLQNSAPGLNFAAGGSNRLIAIRGVGDFARNIGNDARVGVYVDGVYLGRSYAGDPDLTGVERVEVLRGPQGTLFGRNTVAGAISITTRKPGYEFGAELTGEVGNFDYTRLSGRLDVPLVDDKVAIAISAANTHRDGYLHNFILNKDVNELDSTVVRGTLRLDPSEDLEILVSGDYFDSHVSRQSSILVSGPFRRGRYGFAFDADSFDEREIWGMSGTLNYSIGGDYTLTSITAYRDTRFGNSNDEDGTPRPIALSHFNEASTQFTQELRISSPATGPFDFVAGLYYLNQDITTATNTATTPPIVLPGRTTGLAQQNGTVDVSAVAGFVHANYRLSDMFELTAGVRVTNEEKSIDWAFADGTGFIIRPIGGMPGSLALVDERSDFDVSPRIGVNIHTSEDVMFYANASLAKKTGGWNADFVSTLDQIGFDSEKVTNFEVGIKTALLDNRVRANLAAFHAKYDDFQVFQLVPTVTNGTPSSISTITNAGELVSKGVEAELTVKPLDILTLAGSVAYNDAHFISFPNCSGIGVNCDGKRPPYAPEWKAYVSAELAIPVGENRIVAFMDYGKSGHYFTHSSNAADFRVPGYGLVNGRLSFELGENFEFSIWAKNLTDEYYVRARARSFLQNPNEVVEIGRTYGLRVSAKF